MADRDTRNGPAGGDAAPHGAALPSDTPNAQFAADDGAHAQLRNNTDEENEDTYVHPVSQRLFDAFPPLQHMPVLGRSLEVFNPRFVFSLGATRLLSKGIAHGFIRSSIQGMMLNHYLLTATRYQRLSALYSLGWSVNAFVGILADTFALGGYTKRWYLVFSALVGCAFAFVYALLPGKSSYANLAAAFLFLHAVCNCTVDTLSQAFYSRRIRRFPKHGPALVSWVWWMALLGTMIAGVIQGPLTDMGKPYVGPCIAGGLLFLLAIVFAFNAYGERKNFDDRTFDAIREAEELQRAQEALLGEKHDHHVAQDKLYLTEPLNDGALHDDVADYDAKRHGDLVRIEPVLPVRETCLCGLFDFNRAIIRDNWKLAVMCAILTSCVIVQTCVSILGTKWKLTYTCIAISVVFTITSFIFLPRVIAKAAVFLYFNNVLYLTLPGALNTFYVATPACLPDGPHFSYTFFTTMSSALSNVTSMVGIAVFNAFLSKYPYPYVMCLTTFLQILASLVDLIIVMRWNTHIGIPDHAMYLCGYTIVYEVIEMLSHMPMMLLMSRVCPRGTESIIFTFLAGVAHIGSSTSTAIGSILMETRFPVVSKPPAKCNFSNVKWLIITGHLCCPLLILPLAFLLLPYVRINENIDVNGKAIKAIKRSRKDTAGNRNDADESASSTGRKEKKAPAVGIYVGKNGELASDDRLDEGTAHHYGEKDDAKTAAR
ncbi:biopterin transporter [Strigomonas culicis]|uniref:Biopterin transporter n=1 Tax=Strigomonas culicis TaxID=28005 RepID=S9VHM4_9TRYP|nr:biopterin transporter [Strigomonas culicis]|eukprot:EPY22690.1 biopterin transporter [Strigomonas culicis]